MMPPPPAGIAEADWQAWPAGARAVILALQEQNLTLRKENEELLARFTAVCTVHLKQGLEALLQRPVDLVRPARAHEPRPAPGDPAGGCQRVSGDLQLVSEDGQDLFDVICMQFLVAGEALKRLEKLEPGLLARSFPDIDWKGAMGFRDVIAHQYFDLDTEQVLLICQEALPALYFPEVRKANGEQPFKSQCIPTDSNLLTVEHYKGFLAERRRLIAERLNTFLGSSEGTASP
jgi:uncharacterized protein with HEPN domain